MLNKSRFSGAVFPLLFFVLSCIPNGNNQGNAYEIQQVRIDSIWMNKDTLQAGTNQEVFVLYITGAKDCYQFNSSKLTKDGDTFSVFIDQKVFVNRICIQLAQLKTEVLSLKVPDSGRYCIVANAGTPDSINKYFWVRP